MAPRLTCDCESCQTCYQRAWRRKIREAKRAGASYRPDPKRQRIGRLPKMVVPADIDARMDAQALETLPALRAYWEPRHYSSPIRGL